MPNNNVSGWAGWIYFAGILMVLRGISDAFIGITALVNEQYLFITGKTGNLVVTAANTDAWGWVMLATGAIVLAAGFSLLHGSNWARLFAIVFTSFAFLANMAFLGVFPVWSIVAMAVNVFVLYALIVHGKETAR